MADSVGRPEVYHRDAVVTINTKKAKAKVQGGSDRRAVLNFLIDNGGKATIGEINDRFGFDLTNRVVALARKNWVEVE